VKVKESFYRLIVVVVSSSSSSSSSNSGFAERIKQRLKCAMCPVIAVACVIKSLKSVEHVIARNKNLSRVRHSSVEQQLYSCCTNCCR